MEILELSVICMTAVISVGILGLVWLKIRHMEEMEKNYREELRSQRRSNYSPASRDSDGGEPDLMTFLIDFATKNPEMLKKILGNVGGSVPVPPKEN